MTANQTIDIVSYVNTTAETQTASKSSADNSCKFGDIFEGINKTYSSDNSDNSGNKTNDTEKTVTNDTQEKNNTPNQDKTVNNTENKNVEDTSESKEQKTMDTQAISSEKPDDKTEIPTTSNETSTQVQTIQKAQTEIDSDLELQITEFEKIAQNLISEVKTNNSTTDVKAPVETNSENPSDANSTGVNLSVNMENLIALLTQITKTDNTAVVQSDDTVTDSKSNLTKILNNLNNASNGKQNTNQQNNTVQDVSTQTALDSIGLTAKNTDTQAPLIEVATQSLVSDSDIDLNNAKQNTKDLLDKTALTQEILDKTNAKVVSVETSSSSGQDSNGSLLKKQNPQEQVLKLEIEDNTAVQDKASPLPSAQFTVVSDTSTQTNFTNNINNAQVQNQTTAQAQTPKELSQADIIAQLNKQISFKNLQDEGTSKITMVLKPENLGKINLELVNSKEGFTAQFTTDNPQVKEILDKSLNNLKDSLGNQGVSVNNVNVKLNETQKESNTDMSSFGNQMGKNDQQPSDNTNRSNENEFSLEDNAKGINQNTDSGIENETEMQNETKDLALDNSISGRIDYKV